jgi:hypothetical protein
MYRNLDQKCLSLLPIFGDVLNYSPPSGPIICFMCNPFDQTTLRAIFKSWRMRYERGEREIRVLYLNMRGIAESAEILGWRRGAHHIMRRKLVSSACLALHIPDPTPRCGGILRSSRVGVV